MTGGSRRGVALATGGVAGLALASLVLPQLADTLSPTALGIGLLTLVLGLGSLLAQRLNDCYNRRSDLDKALRARPPARIADTDLITLGVHPAYDERGIEEPYRQRSDREDARLWDRVGTSQFVVIHGPAGCGKSRAAVEAAKRGLGEVPVIVPFDADGLRLLQDSEFEAGLSSPHRRVCLWLDSLERFAEALDVRALAQNGRGPAARAARRIAGHREREVWLIATIRTDEWERLRAAADQPGQAMRSLDAIASTVALGALPPADAPLIPSAPSGGLGDDAAPWPPADGLFGARGGPDLGLRGRSPWADIPAIVLATLVGGVTVLLIVGFFDGYRRLLAKPPPISDQIAMLTASLEKQIGHGQIVFNDRVWMHSTEEQSWIIGLHHVPTSTRQSDTQSDELRVYDVHNGWLDPELSFKPSWTGPRAAALWPVPDDSGEVQGYRGSGGGEFIAGYEFDNSGSPRVIPFAVYWDERTHAYKLKGLTKYLHAEYSPRNLSPDQASFRRREYGGPWLMLENQDRWLAGNWGVQGYPVAAFALTEQPSGRLLTGYFFGAYQQRQRNLVELQVTQLRSSGTATACFRGKPACGGPREVVALCVPPDKSDNNALLEEWPKLKARWSSSIQIVDFAEATNRTTPKLGHPPAGTPRATPLC